MFGLSRRPRLNRQWRAALPDHVIALTWSADDRALAAAAVSGPIAVIETSKGTLRHTLPGHGFGTTSVTWLGGDTLVSIGQDGKVRFREGSSGAERHAVDAGASWGERVAASACERYVASAAGRKVRLWDREGALVQDYPEHASTVTDLVWRPVNATNHDGSLQLTSSAYGGVCIWSPTQNEPLQRFSWKGSILRMAWSPDGKYLATGDQDSTVHFWIAALGQDLHMFGYPMKVRELSWDKDSRYLATGGGSQATLWDCSGAGPEGTTPLQLPAAGELDTVNALAFQRAGPFLASGGSDGRVALWEPGQSKRVLAETRLPAPVSQVVWSHDDKRLAVGLDNGEVLVYGT
jgi:WD40 repeat protein